STPTATTTPGPTRFLSRSCDACRNRPSSAPSITKPRPRHPLMAKRQARCHSRRLNLKYPPMKTLICDCNKTMPLDQSALTKALGADASDGLQTLHTTLCRREAAAFQRAAKSGEDLVVACTQESRLFVELNAETEGAPSVQERPIRFVNIRETGG